MLLWQPTSPLATCGFRVPWSPSGGGRAHPRGQKPRAGRARADAPALVCAGGKGPADDHTCRTTAAASCRPAPNSSYFVCLQGIISAHRDPRQPCMVCRVCRLPGYARQLQAEDLPPKSAGREADLFARRLPTGEPVAQAPGCLARQLHPIRCPSNRRLTPRTRLSSPTAGLQKAARPWPQMTFQTPATKTSDLAGQGSRCSEAREAIRLRVFNLLARR